METYTFNSQAPAAFCEACDEIVNTDCRVVKSGGYRVETVDGQLRGCVDVFCLRCGAVVPERNLLGTKSAD